MCIRCNRQRVWERYHSNLSGRLGYLLYSARQRARRDNLPFDIDVEHLVALYQQQDGRCFYTGEPLELSTGDTAISIDRQVPVRGYVRGNLVLVSWIANQMKSHMDHQTFLATCQTIIARHG
jgi:hypothetical protein